MGGENKSQQKTKPKNIKPKQTRGCNKTHNGNGQNNANTNIRKYINTKTEKTKCRDCVLEIS